MLLGHSFVFGDIGIRRKNLNNLKNNKPSNVKTYFSKSTFLPGLPVFDGPDFGGPGFDGTPLYTL